VLERWMPWLVLLAACAPGAPTLPTSTATRPLPTAEASLTITPSAIRLDAATVGSGPLDRALPAITAALHERRTSLQGSSARDPAAPAFRGTLLVEIDASADAADLVTTLERVTAAGWPHPWIVVRGPDGQKRGVPIGLAALDGGRVTAATVSAPDREAGGYANPRLHLDAARGIRVRAFDRVVDDGDGLWLPCAATPCRDRWPHVELNRVSRRLKLDHPRDRAVLVTVGPGVRVQDLVDTLDHARDDAPTAAGSRTLFPVAVLGREGTP